jgi:hypothetical protein
MTDFIQKLFTSRDNNANSANFVGQSDRIWWDPITNAFYYSDGNTPGGIPVGTAGGVGSPGGPVNSIQFNAGGSTFGGDSNLTFDGSNVVLVGNITSTYIIGDGSQLTNLPLSNYTGNITANNVTSTTANLGNFYIYDQTLAGTIVNRDVTIKPLGTGNLELLGPFHIHTDGNIENTATFSVKADGQVLMLVTYPDANSGAVEIVGSTTGASVPLGNPGGMLHVTGQPSVPSRIYNDGVSNYPLYVGRRYNGTTEAPTGVLQNQVISRLGANPYLTDDANFTTLGTAQINFIATEDQTTSAQGSKITMNVTPTGSNLQAVVAEFSTDGILLTGNVLPQQNDTYSLGNTTLRWISGHFGNAGIYIQDTTLGTDGQISLDNGIMLVDTNIDAIQVGNTLLTQTGINTVNPSLDIEIGIPGDTGNTFIKNAGIKFNDGTQQTTAAIPLGYMGAANGVATLGADSKVIPSQLPAGAVFFKGIWDASTNTPFLTDGVGTAGWEYQCTVSGTVDFGAGPIAFISGDFVIYNGSQWQRIPGSGAGVVSFNGNIGVVTLSSGDVTTALSSGAIVNSKLQNSNVTINTGAGLQGGGVVDLGGNLTLTANVRDITAGTGVTVTSVTGNYTIAIGQPVGTANSVTFFAVTSNSTIQATGNITGGNISTAGKIVATGNIETSGNIKTTNTTINSSMTSTGNVQFTGPNISLGATNNLHFTGGTSGQFLTTDGTGNLSWSNVSAANITGVVANANYAAYAGNVTLAGQSNITSLGTLTSITSIGTANLTTASNVSLGPVANVHISGGTANYALITDGAGVLSWSNIAGISGSTSQTVTSWVPALTATGGGTFNYSIQSGYYIKSGRSVTCFFTVAITGATGVTGTIKLSNLPVISINQTNAGGGALDNYTFAAPPNHVTGLVEANSTSMDFYWHDRAGSLNTIGLMTTTNLGTAATLIGRVSYISAT